MFVVAVVFVSDVIAVVDAAAADVADADVAAAAVDLPLCSSSMGSNFVRISFSLFAKRIHCEPLHNHRTRYRLQSKRL